MKIRLFKKSKPLIPKSSNSLLPILYFFWLLQFFNLQIFFSICQEEHLQKVLEYLSSELYIEDLSPEQKQKVDRAEEEEEDEENKKWFKYPFVASELISCDVEDVNERVVEAEAHIQTILSYLLNKQYSKSSLNPSLSQYFTKTISILLQKYYSKVWLHVNFFCTLNTNRFSLDCFCFA